MGMKKKNSRRGDNLKFYWQNRKRQQLQNSAIYTYTNSTTSSNKCSIDVDSSVKNEEFEETYIQDLGEINIMIEPLKFEPLIQELEQINHSEESSILNNKNTRASFLEPDNENKERLNLSFSSLHAIFEKLSDEAVKFDFLEDHIIDLSEMGSFSYINCFEIIQILQDKMFPKFKSFSLNIGSFPAAEKCFKKLMKGVTEPIIGNNENNQFSYKDMKEILCRILNSNYWRSMSNADNNVQKRNSLKKELNSQTLPKSCWAAIKDLERLRMDFEEKIAPYMNSLTNIYQKLEELKSYTPDDSMPYNTNDVIYIKDEHLQNPLDNELFTEAHNTILEESSARSGQEILSRKCNTITSASRDRGFEKVFDTISLLISNNQLIEYKIRSLNVKRTRLDDGSIVVEENGLYTVIRQP